MNNLNARKMRLINYLCRMNAKLNSKLRALSTMSRGQRMLMLSLNKNLKATVIQQTSAQKWTHNDRKRAVSNQQAYDRNVSNTCRQLGTSELHDGADPAGTTSVAPESDQAVNSGGDHVDCQPAKKRRIRPKCRSDQDALQKEKHPMLSSCACKQKCVEKIPQSRREQVYGEFWSMTYNARRAWMFNHIKRREPKRRRTDSKGTYSRTCSCIYFMPQESGDIVQVCKEFFLRTLGYRSDKVITVLLQMNTASQITPRGDKRGRHEVERGIIQGNEGSY